MYIFISPVDGHPPNTLFRYRPRTLAQAYVRFTKSRRWFNKTIGYGCSQLVLNWLDTLIFSSIPMAKNAIIFANCLTRLFLRCHWVVPSAPAGRRANALLTFSARTNLLQRRPWAAIALAKRFVLVLLLVRRNTFDGLCVWHGTSIGIAPYRTHDGREISIGRLP